MKTPTLDLLPIGFSAAAVLGSLAWADQEAAVESFLEETSFDVQPLFHDERFPNVAVTLKGTVVASFGSNHLRVMRSEDGGMTWGAEISLANPGFQGGGMTVDETSGDLLAFVEEEHPPSPLSVYRSSDDGRTWNADEVTISPDENGLPSMHMNERGITLRHGEFRGRLLRAARNYGEGNRPKSLFPTHYTNAIYSDDGGKSWRTSQPFPEMGTGEAAVVELSDGRIYYNTRRHWAPEGKSPFRRWHGWSMDGGETWRDVSICEILPDGPQDSTYGCMGGLTRLPIAERDILIYSNCDSAAGRKLGTVWGSFDGGKTWPVKRLVEEGAFAYSSLASGRPGTPSEGWIYLHAESKPGSKIARFNLRWLLEGEATGVGIIPADLQ
ncbi:MAG: sialidase family protein [Verrucomicrobiota bacterium]